MKENKTKPDIRFKGFTEAWEQRKVSDFLEERNEASVECDEYPLMAFIANKGVAPKGERYDRSALVNDSKNKKYKKTELGDFIYSSNNLETGSIGLNMYGNAVISPVYSIFKSKNEANFDFIGRLLINKRFIHEMVRFRQGVVYGQWKIHEDDFLKIKVHIPDVEEQEKIGAYFANLDNLITLHQRECDQLKELKKSMLKKMFPRDGSSIPEVRFAGFTDAWEQRKFGELLNETRDKTTIEDEDILLSCAIDGMFLNSELFSHFRGSSNIGYLKIKKNNLILSAQNLHLGNCNVNLRFEHGIISPAYKVYELVECNPLFMQAWVKQDTTKEFFLRASTEGASVCRKNIVWEELYKQTLPVPKIDEQEKIGEYFASLDNLITLHQRELEILKNLKKTCLKRMFI